MFKNGSFEFMNDQYASWGVNNKWKLAFEFQICFKQLNSPNIGRVELCETSTWSRYLKGQVLDYFKPIWIIRYATVFSFCCNIRKKNLQAVIPAKPDPFLVCRCLASNHDKDDST